MFDVTRRSLTALAAAAALSFTAASAGAAQGDADETAYDPDQFKGFVAADHSGVQLAAGRVNPREPEEATEASETISDAAPYKHVVIGLDLSKSNPLVDDKRFAAAVADRVNRVIRDLEPGSKVSLRTFGAFSARSNPLVVDYRVFPDRVADANRPRARDVAREVSGVIRRVPDLIDSGLLEGQNFTNIVAFLEDMVANRLVVNCGEWETTFILATDGFEDSQYVRLKTAGTQLPNLPGKPFAGCNELLMLGVGQGQNDPRQATRLRNEWDRWARQEGFGKFTGLTQW